MFINLYGGLLLSSYAVSQYQMIVAVIPKIISLGELDTRIANAKRNNNFARSEIRFKQGQIKNYT